MLVVIDKSIRPSIRCQLGNLTRGEEYIARKKEMRNLTRLDRPNDDFLQYEYETGGIKNLSKKGNKKCYSRLTEYMSNPPLVPPQFITPSSASTYDVCFEQRKYKQQEKTNNELSEI